MIQIGGPTIRIVTSPVHPPVYQISPHNWHNGTFPTTTTITIMAEAITTEDWPEIQPQPEARRHSLRDHLNTGVRVLGKPLFDLP